MRPILLRPLSVGSAAALFLLTNPPRSAAAAEPAIATTAAPAATAAAPTATAADAGLSEPPTPAALSEIERALASDRSQAEATSAPSGSAGTQSLNPDLSLIADFALAAFSDEEHHQTGGHDPTQNGFNLQQLELSAGAAVDPFFRFDANIVFGIEGVEVEEAYATTLDLGARFQARAGQFLTRFGRLNASHPHNWSFVDQPFWLGKVLGPEGNRGLGVELSYLTPLPWYVELVLSATSAAGEGARSFYGENDLGVDGPQDLLYVAAIKQFVPLSNDWSFAFGVSSAFGPNDSSNDARTEIYGADAYLKYRPISEPSRTEIALQAEWIYRRRELADDVLRDAGGYLQLVTRLARRYAVGVRYEIGTPSYGADGSVAEDPLDPEWASVRSRSSLALTFFASEFSRFRLQGSRDAGLSGAATDSERGPSEIWAGFLAAEFITGAHGAHSF